MSGTFETKNESGDIHNWKKINFCHTQHHSFLALDNNASGLSYLYYHPQLEKDDVVVQKFMHF